jgi:hypothetical protein
MFWGDHEACSTLARSRVACYALKHSAGSSEFESKISIPASSPVMKSLAMLRLGLLIKLVGGSFPIQSYDHMTVIAKPVKRSPIAFIRS